MQVLEWISYHVEKNKYDASSIDFSCCNMDGHTLCHCSRDQMRLIFGPLGDELYDRLHEISECRKVSFICRPGSLNNEFESPVVAQDPLLPLQKLCERVVGTQTRVQACPSSAPSMHYSPSYGAGIANPTPSSL